MEQRKILKKSTDQEKKSRNMGENKKRRMEHRKMKKEQRKKLKTRNWQQIEIAEHQVKLQKEQGA